MNSKQFCVSCGCDIKDKEDLQWHKDVGHQIAPRSQVKIHDPKKLKEPEQKAPEKLLEYCKQNIRKLVISQNDNNRIFALVSVKGHIETVELGTYHSIQWLKASYYEEKEEIFSDDSYKAAIELIRAKAQFNEKIPRDVVYKRMAFVGDSLFYDLGSQDWKLVKITRDSIGVIPHDELTPTFQRTNNQTTQEMPNLSSHVDALGEFCKLLRIENDLFKIHLISLLIEHIPTPIMVIIGQQGSIKSTQSGLIKRVIDPAGNKIEDNLSHFPKTLDDLNIHLTHNYLVSFDNVSYISDEVSDTMCKAITGAGYPKRKYYTDSDEIILKYRRKIILNGITVNVDNGDLAERCIQYHTKKISENERLTAQEVESKFKGLLSDLLGQIYIVIQRALRNYDTVKSEMAKLPRMADFAVWGEAISQALGHNKGFFLDLYKKSIEQNNDILNENNPLIPFLEHEMSSKEMIIIPAGLFFENLLQYAQNNHYDLHGRNFPRQANRLRQYFTRSKSLLDENNLTIEVYKNTSDAGFTKNATLVKVRKASSPSPPCSPLDEFTNEKSEHSERGEHQITTFSG